MLEAVGDQQSDIEALDIQLVAIYVCSVIGL